MTVGLRLGNITDEIGSQDFLYSFFSTISFHLEDDGWGTKFPILMNHLYQGKLEVNHASEALTELNTISIGLKKLSPDKVIWNIDNLALQPPWGSNISQDITDLSNYFVTSSGRDMIGVIEECLEELQGRGGVLEIVSY